jgi:hypothetical protein
MRVQLNTAHSSFIENGRYMRFCLTLFVILTAACGDYDCPADTYRVGTGCRSAKEGRDATTSVGDPSTTEVRHDASTLGAIDASLSPTASDASDAALLRESGVEESLDASTNGSFSDTGIDVTRDASGSSVKCLRDEDSDGFGTGPADAPCPPGKPPVAGDCNDDSALAHPGAAEICGDQLDNNCDGMVDEVRAEECNGLDDDCNPATPDGEGACGDFICKDSKCLTSCTADSECAAGLFCLNGSCSQDNDGATCNAAEVCSSGYCCVAAAYCGEHFQTCLLTPGKSCASNGECASGYCAGTCLFHVSNFNERCDETVDCNVALACRDGLCKRALSQYCTQDDDCFDKKCVAQLCTKIKSTPSGS